MRLKSLLLGTTAAFITTTAGTYASEVTAGGEPEPVEYVRICDAYGSGYFYLPGTETCLRVSGYARYDLKGGDDSYTGLERDTYFQRTRADLRYDSRGETDFGLLRTYVEIRYNYDNGADAKIQLNNAYIEIGSFRIGSTDSRFISWTGYVGDVLSDDVVQEGEYISNQVSYTFSADNGFSAFVSAEQGSSGYQIEHYWPHVTGGAKYEQGWGSVAAVAGYDVLNEVWAAKIRLDANFTDRISAWFMAGYKSNGGDFGNNNNYFGTWNGTCAIWGGLVAKVTDKATINAQAAFEDDGTFAAALNVAYELESNLFITPEIDYTGFRGRRAEQNAIDAALKGGEATSNAVLGILRVQRTF